VTPAASWTCWASRRIVVGSLAPMLKISPSASGVSMARTKPSTVSST
jgi:hypothetical protein